MNRFFGEIRKKLGFGCMRLPMKGDTVDTEEFGRMVDAFLAAGFNYFDTAHGYLGGQSELALRECLTSRYPRESYLLADKLSLDNFHNEEEIRQYFAAQLACCGVEYFDFYMMHSQNATFYEDFKKRGAYDTALKLKAEGKVRHVGFSFHDRPEVLEQMLTEYPQMDFVQIQFNYVDMEDAAVEAGKCYEVCVRHNKPVIVMEPVRGGALVQLPGQAQAVFDRLQGGSNASYAIRYAAGFDQVAVVLSGMSSLEQLLDNISYMKEFVPLDGREQAAVKEVAGIFRQQNLIPCTGCRYCIAGCPKHISIADLFADMNTKKQYEIHNSDWYYMVHTQRNGKASDCIKCGACERVCPQHLKIRELLEDVAAVFENGE